MDDAHSRVPPVDAAWDRLASELQARHPGWRVCHRDTGFRAVRKRDDRRADAVSMTGLDAIIRAIEFCDAERASAGVGLAGCLPGCLARGA